MYHAPAGDPLRWRMEDVREYMYKASAHDEAHLYARWHVGEATYDLLAALLNEQPQAE